MALHLPKTILMYLSSEREDRKPIDSEEEQKLIERKTDSLNHLRQALYTCADSHHLWNFYKNSSNTPFLELWTQFKLI